jgi:hypothetical protein
MSERRSWLLAAAVLAVGALIWLAAGSELGAAGSTVAAVACALQATRVA